MSAAPAESPGRIALALTVNGVPRRVEAEPRSHLGDVLRERLDLTGTHLGCEHGVCGACTVLLDGEPARACLTFAGACPGAAVTTIEGLDDDPVAIELRAAFNREHALQCGYCTPGMLVAARDLVLRLPDADERRIRVGLSGNLCRCTGYAGIVRAVMGVIAARRARGIGPESGAERALGPVGARPGAAVATPRPVELRPVPALAPVPASVGDPGAAFAPAHEFTQTIDLPHPPEAVFALLGDIEAVAACLPGAAVTGRPEAGVVEGGLQVRIGPIGTTFRGRARIAHDPASLGGTVRGAGTDAGGRSATEGRIRYRVGPGELPGTARVVLDVGYTLTGPLAQFGRPGLVRDLAGRITADLARNLDARLSGAAAPAPARLDPLRLLVAVVRARLAAWRGRA
ncbi:xanthine dehydrogenase family Fe-S subunit [Methylobacterium oryzihabitans]|uniref:2Fe-2S iron-sulfur cluster binding domain-containing protein n=1 Tax=Methylobacterium oryzihabitans TaxID=2499852 RepID=A0A3S2VQT4_9HYPH|nr:2Fe-2S iron-sulfur cluster-binding protein [Methylobacterium oryzihabitans]RVU14971.1 2Fe-2S iron-sulfur cluster binding domain-containing protein [Methylobacterium oryzihabitans]